MTSDVQIVVPCGNRSCHRNIYIGPARLRPPELKYCKRCEAIQAASAVHCYEP